jgi:hypothetical protein
MTELHTLGYGKIIYYKKYKVNGDRLSWFSTVTRLQAGLKRIPDKGEIFSYYSDRPGRL